MSAQVKDMEKVELLASSIAVFDEISASNSLSAQEYERAARILTEAIRKICVRVDSESLKDVDLSIAFEVLGKVLKPNQSANVLLVLIDGCKEILAGGRLSEHNQRQCVDILGQIVLFEERVHVLIELINAVNDVVKEAQVKNMQAVIDLFIEAVEALGDLRVEEDLIPKEKKKIDLCLKKLTQEKSQIDEILDVIEAIEENIQEAGEKCA